VKSREERRRAGGRESGDWHGRHISLVRSLRVAVTGPLACLPAPPAIATHHATAARTFLAPTTASSCSEVVGMVAAEGGAAVPGGGGVKEVEPTVLDPTRGRPGLGWEDREGCQ
jgi:hypothetical protein